MENAIVIALLIVVFLLVAAAIDMGRKLTLYRKELKNNHEEWGENMQEFAVLDSQVAMSKITEAKAAELIASQAAEISELKAAAALLLAPAAVTAAANDAASDLKSSTDALRDAIAAINALVAAAPSGGSSPVV